MRQNLHDYVAEQIRNKIYNKSYESGFRLPNEYQLAEEYDVCRYTIREAIKKLTATGLVEVQRGRGTFVSGNLPSSYIKNVVDLMLLNDQEIQEIFVARIAIEEKTAGLAAQNATPEEIHRLEKSIRAMEKALTHEQTDVYNDLDLAFHDIIAEIAKNRILLAILTGLHDMIRHTIDRSAVKIGNLMESMNGHYRLLECVKNRDDAKASREMIEHLERCLYVFTKPVNEARENKT